MNTASPTTSPSSPSNPEDERVLSTLNADGSRRWLKPVLSKGRFLARRRAVGYALIALFTVLPHLRINGKPPMLIDIPAREYTFFGTTLYPTDTLLLALLLFLVFLSVFFFTAIFGRIWCGWACPQTVYLELVYRPIERFFHGAPGRKPKNDPWRTPAKLIVYVLVSVFLAHTFLAYFVPTDELRTWVTRSPLEHPMSFLVMLFVTAAMLFDFGFFREQVCIVACPYGRFQSAMLDKHSLIVGYDTNRGEPRGKRKKKADVALNVIGDCVDCGMCVRTCPTGIDIRDGLQLECVNCTQCIDACDSVMDKLGRPRGLIRYASQASIDGEPARKLRPRVVIYPAIMTVIAAAFITLLVTRSPIFVSVLRGPGLPFSMQDDGLVSNNVRVKIQNRTDEPATYELTVPSIDGAVVVGEQNPMVVEPGQTVTAPMLVRIPSGAFGPTGRVDVDVRVASTDGSEATTLYSMLGPASGPAGGVQ